MPERDPTKDLSDFKLIAIRPHADCNELYLKALKGGVLYQLNNDFVFKPNHIEYKRSYPLGIFSAGGLSVNLSAVVGKNGSGKSSLFELMFAGIYHLAVTEHMLNPASEIRKVNNRVIDGKLGAYEIRFDLYYHYNSVIQKIAVRDEQIVYQTYYPEKADAGRYVPGKADAGRFDAAQFFYSVVINYSFYALNSSEVGEWVKLLFHKNDGYQAPIVINPLRNEGNIDVNRERELIHTRMLYALLQPVTGAPEDSLLHLAPGKIARKVALIMDRSKFKNIKIPKQKSTAADFLFKYRLPEVFERFLGDRKFVPADNLHNFYGQLYIIRKLIAIADTYDPYRVYRSTVRKDGWIKSRKERETFFCQYLDELAADHSHITFKLRRALNALRYDFYDKNENDQTVDISRLSKLTFDYSAQTKITVIELLPPPYLFVDIDFDHGSFNSLSSGEKQKIYSGYSVIYHLINLDSVKKELKRYSHVLCILDEIELYYHPEMQRTYVQDLLGLLKKTQLKFIESVHFCFITHSPFILSDIPRCNILYLKLDQRGKALPAKIEQETFGANIYDLLSHSFYFQNGFVGDQAQSVIQRVIDNLQARPPKGTLELTEEELEQVIAMIGEPFLKDKLIMMFEKKFKRTDVRTSEIEMLEHRILRLKKGS